MADQRIVFYSASFFKIDGVTLTLRGLISHITNERGAQVMVLTADNPSDSDIHDFTRSFGGLASVMRVAGGPVPAPGADYALGLRVPDAIKQALQAYCPTAVHITNPDLAALWLINWVLREREDCIVMATLHTDFMEIVNSYWGVGRKQALWATSSFLRHVYGRCPAVYAPTEFMKRKVEGEAWDTQLGVWGRGVDPDLFSPARRCQDLREQLGLGPNDIAALWLGRVVKEKQPGVWLQAVQQVQREAMERYDTAVTDAAGQSQDDKGMTTASLPPRVVGICVGEGEAMSMLTGVDGVVCVGWKAGEELAKVVASCDIMVAPSEIETFGRVTLEAMSCGLPCVVNRECGEHLVKDGANGFCVPSGDESGYVEGLRKLVENKELRSKMSSTGRQMALGYGTTALYDGMLEIYRSCRETQNKALRASKAKKRSWSFWEAFGLLIYYVFEVAKMMTVVMTFFTQGSDSEVVRLSVKAFRNHITLLGHLLGLNSLAPSPEATSLLINPSVSKPPSASGGSFSSSSSSEMSRSAWFSSVRVGGGGGSGSGSNAVGVGGTVRFISSTRPSLILQQLALAMTIVLLLAAVAVATGAAPSNWEAGEV
eukprot:g8195.t1